MSLITAMLRAKHHPRKTLAAYLLTIDDYAAMRQSGLVVERDGWEPVRVSPMFFDDVVVHRILVLGQSVALYLDGSTAPLTP